MGLSTGALVAALMLVYAGAMGDFSWEVVTSILGFQIAGLILGFAISKAAK